MIDSASQNAMYKKYLNTYSYLTSIGIISFILGYLMLATWMITGEKQARIYRKEYLNAILK